jgi:probable addiction module antidote protein
MTKRLKSYQEKLLQDLQDPVEANAYLNAALMDEDPRIFLVALKNVVDAQKNVSRLARKAKLNRENLYRMLSVRGNPRFSSIVPLLGALGMHLAIHSDKRR